MSEATLNPARPPSEWTRAQEIELRERIKGRWIIASVSGGKDSAALSLWLKERNLEHERVFMDTGWEHDATYQYVREELPRALGPITTIQAKHQMEELIRRKMMFPSRHRRFCTQELKVEPMKAFLSARVDAGEELINAVGIRHQESKERAQLHEWEWSDGFDCEVWRPLIRFSEQDVIDIHTRHGLKPNPLYLMGASRVGCWPCIYARKSEIRLMSEVDPGRIDRIRKLELEIEAGAKLRYDRDVAQWALAPDPEPEAGTLAHERWESKRDRLSRPFTAPRWFQQQKKDPATGRYPFFTIDEAVAWAKTSRGGRQFEMFAAAPHDAGCMRWGLCETDKEPEESEP